MTIKQHQNPDGSRGVICPRCQRTKPPEGFYSNGYCKPCGAKYHRDRLKDPVIAARVREQGHAYYRRHPDRVRKRAQGYGERLKAAVMDHYGNHCACCKEATKEFLSIDHPNNDGAAHRRSIGSGYAFYRWLKRHAYPSGYRVLCFNCNMALGLFGYCPHTSTETERHGQRRRSSRRFC